MVGLVVRQSVKAVWLIDLVLWKDMVLMRWGGLGSLRVKLVAEWSEMPGSEITQDSTRLGSTWLIRRSRVCPAL